MTDTSTMPAFAGFSDPHSNFTEMPLALIESLPLFKSLAELKIVLYVLRHTWGYREYDEGKRISVEEFENGRKRRDGSRIDAGVGMVKNSITDGIDKAVEHGFLQVEVDDHDKARIVKYYSLCSFKSGGQELNPEGQKLTPGIPEVDPRTEIDTSDRDSKNQNTSPQPAVTVGEIANPKATSVTATSLDDNNPKAVENAQADNQPAYVAPVGTRWIYPIQGDRCHLVRDANQPTVTLCGLPLPSYGGPGGKTQVQCAACLKATEKKPKAEKPPRQPQPIDPLFDAVALFMFEAKTPADRNAVGGRVAKIVHGDKKGKRCSGLIAYEKERKGIDTLDYGALAKDVERFWTWFKRDHPTLELKDCAAVMTWWVKWRSSGDFTQQPKPEYRIVEPEIYISPTEAK